MGIGLMYDENFIKYGLSSSLSSSINTIVESATIED